MTSSQEREVAAKASCERERKQQELRVNQWQPKAGE